LKESGGRQGGLNHSLQSDGAAAAYLHPVRRKPREKGHIVQVLVRDNNVDQALRVLKKKMQREGLFREMKARSAFEKPSEKRARANHSPL
jgi:ribosomal protein S21